MNNEFWTTSDEFPGSISLPYGIKTSHTWHEVGQILRIINDLHIGVFIELGSHVGGLASILIPIEEYKKFDYLGIERDQSIIHPSIYKRIYIGDILTSVDVVKDYRGNRKSFIYCDGGNKIKEMWTYFQTLNLGDVIACHDYFDYQAVFELPGFGIDDDCRCKPEVHHKDLDFLFDDSRFDVLPDYLLRGTRIMGFIRK